jgi:hypothetical protein
MNRLFLAILAVVASASLAAARKIVAEKRTVPKHIGK